MKKRNRRERMFRWMAASAVGLGTPLALSGCDPAVQDAWLTGLETTTGTLLSTFNTAFYLSLEDENSGTTDTGLTTT